MFAQNPFPYVMPKEKPTFKMSCAMNRVYDNYGAATPQLNELYTNFKYSPLTGFDYHNDDGTVTRRDPSRIIKVNGKYYMWYTKRCTPTTFVGTKLANDTIPSVDWDLCDIAYATSKDGFHWTTPSTIQLKYPSDRLRSWHLDVIHTEKGYEMLVVAFYKGHRHREMNLYYTSYSCRSTFLK